MRIYLAILVVFPLKSIFGQSYEWKKLEGNFHQSVIVQNSPILLENEDYLTLSIYHFDREETINMTDSTKQTYAPSRLTFEDFKYKISLNNFSPELTVNSEFLIKYDNGQERIFQYEVYFLDTATKKEVNDLKNYLYENFEIGKLEYISKEEAIKEAAESIGAPADELWDGHIFPASLKIELNRNMNLKTLERKFKKLINGSREIPGNSGIYIFKIQT